MQTDYEEVKMDWKIALDVNHHTLIEDGAKAESSVIYIPPGKVALLSMYNMLATIDYVDGVLSTDDCAEIQKLSFGATPELAEFVSCDQNRNLSNEMQAALRSRRMFKEPVTQCGQCWTINPCNNFVLIPTPGFYSIILYDVDQIDVAYIEYILIDVADAAAIPDEFKLGSTSFCQ